MLPDHGATPTGSERSITTVIWHNDHTVQPVKRSLLAYDH
jgi:hypothetical protein